MVVQFGDAQMLLRGARRCRKRDARDGGACYVFQRERFAEIAEVPRCIASDELALGSSRTGRALAKCIPVWRYVNALARQDNGPAFERKCDAAAERPSAHIDGSRTGVSELDEFLILNAARRICLDVAKRDDRRGRLAGRDSRAAESGAEIERLGRGVRRREIADPWREVFVFDAVHRLRERDDSTASPVEVRIRAPLRMVGVHVGLERGFQDIHAVLEPVRREKLIVHSADAAHEHGAGARVGDDGFLQAVELVCVELPRTHAEERMARTSRSRGRILRIDDRVGVQRIGAEAKVEVPRDEHPFARAVAVAIHEVVFVRRVDVLRDRDAGHEVHDLRHVEIVKEPRLQRRAGEAHGGDDRIEVGVAFVEAGLFIESGRSGEIARAVVADGFVVGAVGVESVASEEIAVGLLDIERDGVKCAVLPDVDREYLRRGEAGGAVHLAHHLRADVAFIGEGRIEVELIHAALRRAEAELAAFVELDLVALLRPADGRVAADAREAVVVKLAVVKHLAPRAGDEFRSRRVFDKAMDDRQRRSDCGVRDHRAFVFGRFGNEPPRCARGAAFGGHGGDIPADHLSRRGTERCGDRAGEKSIARQRVAIQPVVVHRGRLLRAIHEAVAQCRAGDGIYRGSRLVRANPRRHVDGLSRRRRERQKRELADERAARLDRRDVWLARSRHGKERRLRARVLQTKAHVCLRRVVRKSRARREGERRVKAMHNRRSIRRDERDVLAIRIELEIRVQRLPGDAAVLPARPDEQILPAVERHRGEAPFHEVRGDIREVVAVQIHRPGRSIIKLDPVRRIAVLVFDSADVVRHVFVDDERRRRHGRRRVCDVETRGTGGEKVVDFIRRKRAIPQRHIVDEPLPVAVRRGPHNFRPDTQRLRGREQRAAVSRGRHLQPVAIHAEIRAIRRADHVLPRTRRENSRFLRIGKRACQPDVIAQLARAAIETEMKLPVPILHDARPDRTRIRPHPRRDGVVRRRLRKVRHDHMLTRRPRRKA